MEEISDADLAQVESPEDGLSTNKERSMAVRIRRLEKQYTELVGAAEKFFNDKEAAENTLQQERSWTYQLSEEVNKWIRKVDTLELTIHQLAQERDRTFLKIAHNMGMAEKSSNSVEMKLDISSNTWESN